MCRIFSCHYFHKTGFLDLLQPPEIIVFYFHINIIPWKNLRHFYKTVFLRYFVLWKIKYFSVNQLRLWYQFTMDKEGFWRDKEQKDIKDLRQVFFFFFKAPFMPLKILSMVLVSLFHLTMFFHRDLVSYVWSCFSEKLGAEGGRFCCAFASRSVFDEAVGQYIWVNMELNLYFRETSLWAGSLLAQIAPAYWEMDILFLTSCWKLKNTTL